MDYYLSLIIPNIKTSKHLHPVSGSSEAFIGTLSSRIAACEESCQRIDSFVERFKDLATKVQEGFADARGEDVNFQDFSSR